MNSSLTLRQGAWRHANIGRGIFRRLAQQMIAVRLEHNHRLSPLRHGADEVGCRRLDVVQDVKQKCGVVVTQRAVSERLQVDRGKLALFYDSDLALDGCVRLIDAVDLAVARGKHLIGKSAAADIEHMAVGGDAQFPRDVEGDLPLPTAHVRNGFGT